jgi:eukaryotic-like serine/threonine-protein kinase
VDFGLARLMVRPGEETTASFAAMGSAAYMAPEQAEGKKVGTAADIYSLGAILYFRLCKRPPRQGSSNLDTLRRVVNDDPVAPRTLRRDVPRDLEAICLKCLTKEPAHRYASALVLSQDLRRFLAGEPPRARPPGNWERLRRKIKRMPAGVTAIAVVAISVVLVMAVQRQYRRQLNAVSRKARDERAKSESQQIHANCSKKIRQAD